MEGKIVKGIAGFYYVYTAPLGLLECKAKGVFRKEKIKPLVGDDVIVEVISPEEKTGNIEEILPRRNELIRPAVANVDQALVIFAAAKPKPNFNLLDRFLLMMEYQKVPTVICFNKTDMVSSGELSQLMEVYAPCGYPLLFTSAKEEEGLEQVKELLKNKTTVVAGPSGVGKSSIVNLVQQDIHMEIGTISEKIARGKHTTRHSQLILVDENTYILDTPGFSSMYALGIEEEQLKDLFPEFEKYEPYCKFQGCMHMKEPQCGVKEAVEAGGISSKRYENYRLVLEEIRGRKKY